jgi:NADPH-dependent curcumin reductase CurA
MNLQYFLASRPRGEPNASHVPARDVPVPELAPGEMLLRNLYISLDPAIRGWMGDAPNYIEPIALGDAVRSSVLGRVLQSNSPDFAHGDVAMTMGGWERYTTVPAAALNKLDEHAGIRAACPAGVDVYFDNVGGEFLDATLLCLNKHARVAVCGWISTYNVASAPGPTNLWQLVAESVTLQGFTVLDYLDRFGEGIGQLAQWVMVGELKYREEVVDGLDNILPTFLKLFEGSNQGKLVIRLPEE